MSKSSTIKVFILAILVLISAFLFWQQLAQIFLKGNFSWQSLLWLGIWLLIFLVFLLIFSLLVESKGICFLVYLATLATFFIFFSAPKADPPLADKYYYFISTGLLVLFLILIANRALMQRERNDRLKISLRAVFKSGLMLTLIFLALFIALVDYFYPLIKIGKDGINLPPQVLEWVLKPLGGTISKVLPFFNPNMTVNEMLSMTAAMENQNLGALSPELIKKFQGKDLKSLNIQELLKDPAIAEILKKQAKKIDPQTLTHQRNELAKNLGISLTGNEKLSEIIGKLANQQLSGLLGPFLKYLPIISAVLIFVVLSIIFLPFSWLIVLVALLVFMFLRVFHFVRIEKVMKEGEDARL